MRVNITRSLYYISYLIFIKSMEKYQFVKKLGEGAYGTVIKCVNNNT